MTKPESLEDFYQREPGANPNGLTAHNAGQGHFNVFRRDANLQKTPYSRRDFFKVALIIGTGKIHYADKWITIDKPALLFSSPLVPYAWEPESEFQSGWFCVFTQSFIQTQDNTLLLRDFPLFKIGGSHLMFLDETQLAFISSAFKKMVEEMETAYLLKYELIRNYLYIIMHEAQKIEPASNFKKHINASARISSLFFELLERQFPIDSPENSLKLRTANDFAKNLSVHTNHLNRAVKEITGRTTTEHITERVIRESNALLQHTDWNINQIANGLGFEEPSYFTNFFKKHTGFSPGSTRLATN
jgi:AraC-like DNA-binding protein